jgi:hypothetical protein
MNQRLWTVLRVLANLLGAFGVLIALANPPAVFDSRQSVVFLILSVSVALWASLWMLALRGPFTGPARILELGGLGASIVFIAFCWSKIPSVHDKLVVLDHEGKGPRLGLYNAANFLDPRYGPKLVRSDAAMANRYDLLHDYPDANSVVENRGDYAYLYSSLRVRGKSDEQILADPIGTALFLGTLVAESAPPSWWHSADWLKRDLPLHPSAMWKMGLLPADWARSRFATLMAHAGAADPGTLQGILVVALVRPDFATPEQFEPALEKWMAVCKQSGYPIDATVEARHGLIEVLRQYPGIRFQYPASWSATARDAYGRQIIALLRSGGLQVENREDGFPITISAEFREWDNVSYTEQRQVWKEVEEHHLGAEIPGTHVVRLPYTTHRDVQEMVHSESRGRIGVPTLLVGVGGKTFVLPPVGVIDRNVANDLSRCDPSQDSYKEIYEEFLGRMTLAPWRFGLAWP